MIRILLIGQVLLQILSGATLASYATLTAAKSNNDSLVFIESMDKKVKACLGVINEQDDFTLELKPCVSQIHQVWRVNKAKQLIAVESGLCLDAGNAKEPNNVLTLSKCGSSKQQKWKALNKNNLKNADGRCLVPQLPKNKKDVLKASMQKCANKLRQKWLIVDTKGYAAAKKHDKAKGVAKLACPENQFAHVAKKHSWGGYCVSCPAEYQRTMEKVDDPKACKIK